MEVSIVQLLMKHSQIKQFKYFKILIQEFHIKVDLGFVNALVEMLQSVGYTEIEEVCEKHLYFFFSYSLNYFRFSSFGLT